MNDSADHGKQRWQIVLLHGLTGSRRLFAALEERLRAGPVKADTLSFDLPGFGENKGVPSTYGVSEQLLFITDSIEKRFPTGQLVLAGHSLGGVLALAWTMQHLHRVSRIILLNTPLGDSREDILHSFLQERFGWAAFLLKHKHLAHFSCIVLRGAQFIRAFRFAKPPYVSEGAFRDYTQHTSESTMETVELFLGRTRNDDC